jgi:hypothetical protein
VTLDGRLEELRGQVTSQGGPYLMDLSFAAFLDVVWAHIVTPPAMADAFEWRETMFCWFYLGHEPEKISVYDPKTRKHTTKLKPRDPMRTVGPNAVAIEPAVVARSADAEMIRLREKVAANREKRTGSRSAKRVVPQATHDAGAAEG